MHRRITREPQNSTKKNKRHITKKKGKTRLPLGPEAEEGDAADEHDEEAEAKKRRRGGEKGARWLAAVASGLLAKSISPPLK